MTTSRPEPSNVLMPVWTRVSRRSEVARRSVKPRSLIFYGELLYLVAFATALAIIVMLFVGGLR